MNSKEGRRVGEESKIVLCRFVQKVSPDARVRIRRLPVTKSPQRGYDLVLRSSLGRHTPGSHRWCWSSEEEQVSLQIQNQQALNILPDPSPESRRQDRERVRERERNIFRIDSEVRTEWEY
jgi:hypothetical protein